MSYLIGQEASGTTATISPSISGQPNAVTPKQQLVLVQFASEFPPKSRSTEDVFSSDSAQSSFCEVDEKNPFHPITITLVSGKRKISVNNESLTFKRNYQSSVVNKHVEVFSPSVNKDTQAETNDSFDMVQSPEEMVLEPIILHTEDSSLDCEAVSIKQEQISTYQEVSPYFSVSHSLFDSSESGNVVPSQSAPNVSAEVFQGLGLVSNKPSSVSSGTIAPSGSSTDHSSLLQCDQLAFTSAAAPHYYAKTSYICPECGKCFTSSFSLALHQRGHTENRPHQCPHCDYKAKLKHHIKCHVRRRHPQLC